MKKICIILFALVSLYLSVCGELKLVGKEVVKAESVILKNWNRTRKAAGIIYALEMMSNILRYSRLIQF